MSNEKKVILVAGMRHSGSTALFNIIRLSLKAKKLNVISGYSEKMDISAIIESSYDYLLIKTHEPRDDLIELADLIITTTRDLRDSVASARRRNFYLLEHLGSLTEYAKYNRLLHDFWLTRSDYNFLYEKFMNNRKREIDSIIKLLKLEGVDSQRIIDQVENLPTSDYGTTLLSSDHITDPSRNKSYKTDISTEELKEIERNSYSWLISNGYEEE